MTILSDLTVTPLSGFNHIDALLGKGPDWNYIGGNTIKYTFSTSSGNETFEPGEERSFSGAVAGFNATQQANARKAIAYISSVTGITFTETADGNQADLHFAKANLTGPNYAGLASWSAGYSQDLSTKEVVDYKVEAYVYLDNVEFLTRNGDFAAGGEGYETLLHEIAHALGLKHPFDIEDENAITLPSSEDNTSFTLMSYTESGGPYSVFSPYDLAALNWLYGGDGLGGALGIGSAGGARYLTGSAKAETLAGTAVNDTLRGNGGNDTINGGAGTDTAVFSGNFTSYTFAADGATLRVNGADGADVLNGIEILQFGDNKVIVSTAGGANDRMAADAASNLVDGGAGVDTLVYGGKRADFSVLKNGDGYTVTGAGAIDALVNVERIAFADAALALDIDGNGGKVYRLYRAALDRAPDQDGLGFHIHFLDNGTALTDIARGFLQSPEFASRIGANMTDLQFINKMYQHVLHRAGEQAGIDFYQNALKNGSTREEVLTYFSESPENQLEVLKLVGNGFDYIAFVA